MKYRIKALWNQFATQALPASAPDIQRKEMRRAFYAGVECTLNRLGQEISPGDTLDDPGDERMIKEVNQELQEFLADVKEGSRAPRNVWACWLETTPRRIGDMSKWHQHQ